MNIVERLRKSPFLFAVIDFELDVGGHPAPVSTLSSLAPKA